MVKKGVSLDLTNTIQIPNMDSSMKQRNSGQELGTRKALTVKLSQEQYTRLRLFAARTNQRHQEILVTALEKYMDDMEG